MLLARTAQFAPDVDTWTLTMFNVCSTAAQCSGSLHAFGLAPFIKHVGFYPRILAFFVPRFKRIGLLHHMSGANLGDGASFDAVMQGIRRRWPSAVMMGLSMNPADTQSRYGIPSIAIRRRIWNFGSVHVNGGVSLRQRVKAVVSGHPILLKILTSANAMVFRLPSAFGGEVLFLLRSYRTVRSLDLLIITGGGQLIESPEAPWSFLGGSWQFPATIFKWILLARLARVRTMALNVGAGPIARP
ncbi:MAG TPA: polysaccharide pyruvyl transferase family protein, partial [Terriglobia bacterium]|nr:polysaccharide pyruvyl transferase family protein [Terriglobia bacterium]